MDKPIRLGFLELFHYIKTKKIFLEGLKDVEVLHQSFIVMSSVI